jgi:hypothetical protein
MGDYYLVQMYSWLINQFITEIRVHLVFSLIFLFSKIFLVIFSEIHPSHFDRIFCVDEENSARICEEVPLISSFLQTYFIVGFIGWSEISTKSLFSGRGFHLKWMPHELVKPPQISELNWLRFLWVLDQFLNLDLFCSRSVLFSRSSNSFCAFVRCWISWLHRTNSSSVFFFWIPSVQQPVVNQQSCLFLSSLVQQLNIAFLIVSFS